MIRTTKEAWETGKKVAHSGWQHTDEFKAKASAVAAEKRANDWHRNGPGR